MQNFYLGIVSPHASLQVHARFRRSFMSKHGQLCKPEWITMHTKLFKIEMGTGPLYHWDLHLQIPIRLWTLLSRKNSVPVSSKQYLVV